MAKLAENGEFILSAGEIGSFTVCPEAWRLKTIERVSRHRPESVDAGDKLHREWAKEIDDASDLWRHMKLFLLLLVIAVIFYVLS